MKILRTLLILVGLALLIWSGFDYFNDDSVDTGQVLAKAVLGILCVFGSFLAKRMR